MLMKKIIAALLVCSFGSANAYLGTWNDPLKPFDATTNIHDKVEVIWRLSDNVAKDCETEARKRIKDFKGYGYKPEACAFWSSDKKWVFWTTSVCTIITKKNPTMHDIGHEVRHCFQGHFH